MVTAKPNRLRETMTKSNPALLVLIRHFEINDRTTGKSGRTVF